MSPMFETGVLRCRSRCTLTVTIRGQPQVNQVHKETKTSILPVAHSSANVRYGFVWHLQVVLLSATAPGIAVQRQPTGAFRAGLV
jgi:hypothetical protein